jgi:hypothetical protein
VQVSKVADASGDRLQFGVAGLLSGTVARSAYDSFAAFR